jgi:hypothetical protein
VDIYDLNGEIGYSTIQQYCAGSICELDPRICCCPSGEVVAHSSLIFCEHANAVSPGHREDSVHL